jgi:integrase
MSSKRSKPSKPRSDYPLYAHSCGQWAKKINQRVHYFGPWEKPQAAEDAYNNYREGRTLPTVNQLSVREMVNRFLTSKKRLLDSDELKQSTYHDYYTNCERVLKVFGKSTLVSSLTPLDFERLRADFAKTHGAVTLCGDITCTRVLFKYADDTFDVRVKFGQGFKKPTRATLRKLRQTRAPKMFQPWELRAIVKAAGVQLRAMIYLGVNCGFGNNDCAMLPMCAVDLKGGWINFPRPKTGINRRCPLWPETVKALKAAIAERPTPKDEAHADRLFITKYGHTWEPKSAKENTETEIKSAKDNPVSKEMAKLLKSCKLHRKGVGFYALRHIFQTIGEKNRDKDAVRAIMGHAEAANDMSAVYNEEPVEDSRLHAVAVFVRAWLATKVPRQRKTA